MYVICVQTKGTTKKILVKITYTLPYVWKMITYTQNSDALSLSRLIFYNVAFAALVIS